MIPFAVLNLLVSDVKMIFACKLSDDFSGFVDTCRTGKCNRAGVLVLWNGRIEKAKIRGSMGRKYTSGWGKLKDSLWEKSEHKHEVFLVAFDMCYLMLICRLSTGKAVKCFARHQPLNAEKGVLGGMLHQVFMNQWLQACIGLNF